MAASAETLALIAAAVDEATAVADASDAGDYLTRQEAEAAIAAARGTIQTAIDAVRAAHPFSGYPTVRALKALAARLLDLDRALADELEIVEITLSAERGLLDVARERYGPDGENDVVARAEALFALNAELVNPNRVPAGAVLRVYVR